MESTTTKIAKGVFYTSVGNIAIKFFSAFGYFLIIRKLTVHDYGVFVLLTSFLAIAPLFVYFGFSRIFVSSIAKFRDEKDKEKIKRLIIEFYKTSFIFLIIFYSGIIIFRNYLVEYYDTVYLIRFFWPLIFFSVSQIIINGVLLLLESYEEFKISSILKSVEAFSKSILVLVLYFSLSVNLLFYIYGLSKLIAALLGTYSIFVILKKLIKINSKKEKGILMKILRDFGKWELIRTASAQLIDPIKYGIIKIFVNVEGVAIYDFSLKIYSLFINIINVKLIIFPVISRVIDNMYLVKKIISKSKKYSFYFYFIVYCFSVVFLPAAVKIFAPQYLSGIYIFYIVLLHLFVEVYTIGRTAVMYGLRQQKFLLKIYPISFTLEVVMNILLTKYFGIVGSIISWHLKVIIMNKIISYYLKKKFNLILWNFKDFVSFDEYDKMLVKLFIKEVKKIFNFKQGLQK